jgi:hypothetical protein
MALKVNMVFIFKAMGVPRLKLGLQLAYTMVITANGG